jgi:hypothetical protein
MKKSVLKFLLLATHILLTGCAIQQLSKGMDSMQGKHIDQVIDRIGIPNEEKLIANRKVYIWYVTQQQGLGKVYDCKITVQVDKDEKVIQWDGVGSQFGCQPYAQRFAQ